MDNKDYKNEQVENFFLNTIHTIENMPMDQCSFLLHRYYQEACNPERFNSKFYENQDMRIDDMFKGKNGEHIPDRLKNFISFKSYQHQLKKEERDGVKDEKKSKFNKKRVEELEPLVMQSAYAEAVAQTWWTA